MANFRIAFRLPISPQNLLMLASLFVFLLVIETVATPKSSNRRRNQTMVRLNPSCQSGLFQFKPDNMNSRAEPKLRCIQEYRHNFVRQDMEFDCNDVRSLKSATIDGNQYLIIADTTGVKIKRWNDDNTVFDELQTLPNNDVYDVDVVHYSGQTLLSMAIFDQQGCRRCDDRSHLYRWNRTSQEFDPNPIQDLPSASNIHWFHERYHNQTTLIAVFGDCGCPIRVYYWNRSVGRLIRTDEIHEPVLSEEPHTPDVLIQSVRYQRRQYLLLASLGKDWEDHSIHVFEWTNGQLALFGYLHIPVQERNGLSALEYRGETFMCAVTRKRKTAKFLKLNFATNISPTIEQSGTGSLKTSSNHHLSFCKLFIQSHDLYAAVGNWNANTRLLRYNQITDRFVEVGELGLTVATKDLVNFNTLDDTFLVTTNTQGKCLFDTFD